MRKLIFFVYHFFVILAFQMVFQIFTPQVAMSQNLLYPELSVVPLASDRLNMKSKQEGSQRWSVHLPLQAPAIMTLIAGIYGAGNPPDSQSEATLDEAKLRASAAQGIGAAWIAVTVGLSMAYTPYRTGLVELPKAENNMQDKLARERLAEEGLAKPATLGQQLTLLSVATNLVGSLAVASSAGSKARIVGGISALVSLTPLLFTHDWISTYSLHQEYKKRIYGPITSFGLVPTTRGEVMPTYNLTWQF